MGFPGGSAVKHLAANAGDARDLDSIPGSGRSPGEGNANLLQYSCLENSVDRGAWWGPWGLKELDMTEHTYTQRRDDGCLMPGSGRVNTDQ